MAPEGQDTLTALSRLGISAAMASRTGGSFEMRRAGMPTAMVSGRLVAERIQSERA